jgi:hypothetical protein
MKRCLSRIIEKCLSQIMKKCLFRIMKKCLFRIIKKCLSRIVKKCLSRIMKKCLFWVMKKCLSRVMKKCISRVMRECLSRKMKRCISRDMKRQFTRRHSRHCLERDFLHVVCRRHWWFKTKDEIVFHVIFVERVCSQNELASSLDSFEKFNLISSRQKIFSSTVTVGLGFGQNLMFDPRVGFRSGWTNIRLMFNPRTPDRRVCQDCPRLVYYSKVSHIRKRLN